MTLDGAILTSEHLPNLEWFQGPQLLKTNEGYRMYFSTRIRDQEKYYYSDVSYVDFDSNFTRLLGKNTSPVIRRSQLGTFDHDGIFPFHVIRTSSDRLFGFTCGWKRKLSVDIDMSIGISESIDGGRTFERLGPGPILTATTFEPFLVGDPYVIADDKDTFHMFYISGIAWHKDSLNNYEREYLIMHATSKDLIGWKRDPHPIIKVRNLLEAQAMPSVVEYKGMFHMFYAYRSVFDFRNNHQNAYRLGHAFASSLNGPWRTSSWSFPQSAISDWNNFMQCYPHVILKDERFYLFYNGNGFGRYAIGLLVMDADEMSVYARF